MGRDGKDVVARRGVVHAVNSTTRDLKLGPGAETLEGGRKVEFTYQEPSKDGAAAKPFRDIRKL